MNKWLSYFRFGFVFIVLAGLTISAAAQESTPETPTVALTENYTSADGRASFQYPAGWVLDTEYVRGTEFSIAAATSEQALHKGLMGLTADFLPGEARWFVHIADLDTWAENAPDIRTAKTARNALQVLHNMAAQDLDFGTITPLSIHGYPAAESVVGAANRGEQLEIVVQYSPDMLGLYIITTASDELPRWQDTALAMIDSFSYPLPSKYPRQFVQTSPFADLASV